MKRINIFKSLMVWVTVFCLLITIGFLTGCTGDNNSFGIRDIIKAFGIGTGSGDYDLVISELNADNYGVQAPDPGTNGDDDDGDDDDGDDDGDDDDDGDLDADLDSDESTEGEKAIKDAYHIISSSNNGGTIESSSTEKTGNSNFSVANGESISFTVTADDGYYIEYIRIGKEKTEVNALTFSILIESVGANSTIHAHFKKGEVPVTTESSTSGNKGKGKGKGNNK